MTQQENMKRLHDLREQVRAAILQQDIVQALFENRLEPKYYARYLENVWYYAQHSSIVIGMAGSRCVTSHPKLARYLLHHALEEIQHDEWALEDLAALNIQPEAVKSSTPVPSCAAMVGMEYFVAAHSNPVGIFGWLFVLESMGDDLGNAVAEQVKSGLQLPKGAKFLAGHGEADADHTQDIIAHIQDDIPDEDMQDVYFVADVMADLYVRIFQEIGEDK